MRLTEDAVADLTALHAYLARHDGAESAEYVLGRVEEIFTSLAEHPERGSFPRELLALGIRQYRELYFKPYRIVYQTLGQAVYVMLIADGRRDMKTLLQRRLLGG